jgi:hypothetical protein
MTSSNFVGCSIGRSAGLAPLHPVNQDGRAEGEISVARSRGARHRASVKFLTSHSLSHYCTTQLVVPRDSRSPTATVTLTTFELRR